MAVATIASHANLRRLFVDPELLNSVFQNKDYLRFIRKVQGRTRGGTHNGSTVLMNVKITQNTGLSVSAETDAYDAVTAATFTQASHAFTTIYASFGYYDEVKRAEADGGTYHDMDVQLMDAIDGAVDLFITTMLADAATGLLGHVDDDTTAWGGVDRSSVTSCQSTVVAGGSAALTEAMLNNAYYTARKAAGHGVTRFDLMFSEQTQLQAYDERIVASPQGRTGERGDTSYAAYDFKRIPWYDVPDFVNSEIVFLSGVFDGSGIALYDHNWYDVDSYNEASSVEFMPIQYGPAPDQTMQMGLINVAKTAPSQTRVVSLSGAVIVRKPWKQAKIEALATSW